MTSMPASRSARAMTLAPRSWPSRPGFATRTRILRSLTRAREGERGLTFCRQEEGGRGDPRAKPRRVALLHARAAVGHQLVRVVVRSEERRVGKEWRAP